MAVWTLCKRYAPVVLFPTFAFTAIFADWNHTRKCKCALVLMELLYNKSRLKISDSLVLLRSVSQDLTLRLFWFVIVGKAEKARLQQLEHL